MSGLDWGEQLDRLNTPLIGMGNLASNIMKLGETENSILTRKYLLYIQMEIQVPAGYVRGQS